MAFFDESAHRDETIEASLREEPKKIKIRIPKLGNFESTMVHTQGEARKALTFLQQKIDASYFLKGNTRGFNFQLDGIEYNFVCTDNQFEIVDSRGRVFRASSQPTIFHEERHDDFRRWLETLQTSENIERFLNRVVEKLSEKGIWKTKCYFVLENWLFRSLGFPDTAEVRSFEAEIKKQVVIMKLDLQTFFILVQQRFGKEQRIKHLAYIIDEISSIAAEEGDSEILTLLLESYRESGGAKNLPVEI